MTTLAHVLAGLGADVAGLPGLGRAFAHITQDSRDVQPGGLFVARRGETMDGHVFIADAVARGASAVLAERLVHIDKGTWIVDGREGAVRFAGAPEGDAVAYILTPDSHKALLQVGAWWREQLPVTVVGITGSVGKTSVKEAAASVLSRRWRVLKSERSLNTDVGMALTLLQLLPQHEVAVLEMGMYARGEVASLCRLARPRLGVVTNVGPTHLERLGSLDAIAEAKSELVDALPEDGAAILNADDERVWNMRQRCRARVFSYGLTEGLDLWASRVVGHGLSGISFRLHHGGASVDVQSPLLGRHSVQTALAGAAVGLVMGVSLADAAVGLTQSPSRLRLVVTPAANGATILDDSYNASPASVTAALDLLSDLDGRHVAVLGDMLELGPYEQEGHRLVGRRAAAVADLLVALGERGRIVGEEALRSGMPADRVVFVANRDEAVSAVRRFTGTGDFVLVKGSRGMKMEDIVKALVQVEEPGPQPFRGRA
jgi:UDP-N-acetylmuramoyl-tripeptide--D-alanyl-D-alanine ligase